MNFEARIAELRRISEARGLISKTGIACHSREEKEYRDFQFEMEGRPDWGDLPEKLHQKLVNLKAAYHAEHKSRSAGA